MFIYQVFKSFKEAMKYTLFEVTIIRLNFSGVLEVMIMNLDYVFAPFVLFFVR